MEKTVNSKRIKFQLMPTINRERRVGEMYTSEQLEKCRSYDFNYYDKEDLTDLNNVKINNKKSVVDRVQNYFDEVENPYVVRVGDVGVKINCIGEKDLTDLLLNLDNLN